MSLFDLIVEAANKVKSNGAGLYNKIKGVQAPQLNMELLSEDGGTDVTKTMEMLDKTTPLTFGERMTGRKLSRDFQKYNPETKQFEMTTATINRPGLLQDISQGYEENRFTPASIANLQQNTLDNGREKGFAYRLGEGLGSLARLGNSPLGRGLLVGGLVGATGGNGLEALTYGAGATMLNQGNVLKDQLYRRELEKYGFDTSGIKGYIGDDTFNKYLQSKQMQDNAEYRNLLLQTQMQNQADLLKLKQQEAQRQAKQDAFDNYYKNQNLAQGWAKIEADKNKPTKQRTIPAGSAESLSATYQGLIQMKDLKNKIPELPGRLTTPGIAQLSTLNPLDTKAQAFNQYVKTYKQVIGKGLEGGVLRKEDEYKYDQIIPKVGDTQEVLEQKASQLEAMLLNKYNADLQFLDKAGYETAELQTIQAPSQISNNNSPLTTSNQNVGMVKMKAPDGKIYNVPAERVQEMQKKGGKVIG